MSFKLLKIGRGALCAAALCAAIPSFAGGLPDGYRRLDYIQAIGQCQIKTGVMPACTDRVEMLFRPNAVNVTQNLWCSRDGDGTANQFTAFLMDTAKVRFDRNAGTAGQVLGAGTLLAGMNYLVVADYAACKGVVTNVADNTETADVKMAAGEFSPGSELCLYASHTTSSDAGLNNFASYSLLSFKLLDAGITDPAVSHMTSSASTSSPRSASPTRSAACTTRSTTLF